MRPENTIQTQKAGRHVEEPGDHAEEGQHEQRDRHRGHAFRCMIGGFGARFAMEDHRHLPPHVEGREGRCDQENGERDIAAQVAFQPTDIPRIGEDFVFRPEARERENPASASVPIRYVQ